MENQTAKDGAQRHIEAIGMQSALLKTMGSFKKPADVKFVTQESPIVQMMQ